MADEAFFQNKLDLIEKSIILLFYSFFCFRMIDAYIDLKMEEVMRFEMTPHPVEFTMYYSY